MQRIEQREREKQSLNAKVIQSNQNQSIRQLLQDDSIRIIFEYCRKVLSQPVKQNLSEYSPVNLSKFVFQKQLKQAKQIFGTLPNSQAKIQHFLLIMIKVMNLPFQKWPYYLVGFKDMFNQIVTKKSKAISHQQFFKYVIGQVLDFKQQQNNTEFRVRFQQLKKQDYLLHDNGIRKFYYSTDSKYFFTLDQSSYLIKIYNKQMKLVGKFTPNKQKHGKKLSQILWFDYSQMTSRMAIVLSDCTLSIINLSNYMSKSQVQFDTYPPNQIVISFQQKILKVFYIQMLNRWALFSQDNKFYIFDVEKHRQNDPQYLVTIKVENQDIQLKQLIQLVNLGIICVIAGNQIYFYNENFTQKKHSRFVHSTDIQIFHYCEDSGNYYICGLQKDITIFSLPRNSDNFKISIFDTQLKARIRSFEIFPLLSTLLTVDENHEVKLFDMNEGTCYQTSSYQQIVKNQKNFIKTLKVSKVQFALYQTYTLLFQQQKIAIQKDSQFNFLPNTYYNELKQEFYFSVNNQIISFSVPQGQIRKSYNLNTGNVPKHHTFKLGKNTEIFIIDHQKYIYQAYLKDSQPEGQNKYYKKKVNISEFVETFYDEQIQFVFVVGKKTISSVKNDKFNNFTVNSSLSIDNFPPIVDARYNSNQKQIILLFQNQNWCIIDTLRYKLIQYYVFSFPIDLKQHEDAVIVQFENNPDYQLDILLTNKNQLYFISKVDRKKQVYVKFSDDLPHKLRVLKFLSMRYFVENDRTNKHHIILCDKTGFLLQIDITKIITKNFPKSSRQLMAFRFPVKDTHNLINQDLQPTTINLEHRKILQFDRQDLICFKAHDKQIKIAQRIYLEGMRNLTISVDGQIKLWNQYKLLFELKMPDLKKIYWDMKQIQSVKNQKSVSQIITILNSIQHFVLEKKSPQKLLKLKDIEKQNLQKEIKKFSLDEPIQLQIQNKQIQDIVHKTQQINWYSARSDPKKIREENFSPKTTNFHPWRTKNSFMKIMDKASPDNKYNKKIPFELMSLRTSLDMQDRKQMSKKKKKQSKKQLVILPELNSYVPQHKLDQKKQKTTKKIQQQNQQTFESCLYIKKGKHHKKINQFDEIDKQFKKKWLALTAKKWVPTRQNRKKSNSDYKSNNKTSKQQLYFVPTRQFKYDPIKQVKQLFEHHNRQASITKRGRFINIPELSLRKQDLFSND